MTDLLHRLAARTLGHAPTLAPRVPTRFEPAAEPSIVDTEAPASTVDFEPARVPGAPAAPPVVPGVPRRDDRPASASEPPAAPARPRSARVEPDRAVPAAVPRLVTPELVLALHAAQPVAAGPAALFPPGQPRVDAAVAAPLPPLPPPAPGPARRGAPAAPPDVHITIGRIEVRAEPAAPVPAPAAAGRPQPTQRPPEPAVLTLSAYLRGDDGRPR
jgi:hypothetical protein